MLNIIITFIISFSLALFCLGKNFYVNLHLGYEFVAITISLQIAAFFFAVALSKTEIRIKTDALVLTTLFVLMASTYLLFAIDYAGLPSYLIALACFVLPVVALGLCIINSSAEIPLKIKILSVFIGLIAGMVVAFMVLEREGLWMIFSLSAAALTLSILLMANASSVSKIATLGLFIGGVLLVNNGAFSNQLTSWTLSGKPVTKPLINILKNPDQHYRSLDSTIWSSTGRTDIISSSRSRNEGYAWVAHNAGHPVPFVDEEHASIAWWKKNYPLMALPFELKKPSTVLTVAAAKGPDVGISRDLYGAETTAVYHDCATTKYSVFCDDSSLNIKLDKALNSKMEFGLVSFSMPYQVAGTYVAATAQHEAIHTLEVFQKLYDKLNNNGLLAINANDPVMLHKTLSYVWRVLSEDTNEKIINFEKNIRVLQLSTLAPNRDTYNYLVLVSKQAFSVEMLNALNDYIRPAPIIKVIYDSYNNIPPYIFFKQLNKITVADAVLHLTRASSWQYKEMINLEPSRVIKPDFFHLAVKLHPFMAALSVVFLCLGVYGLLFSKPSLRQCVPGENKNSPALSVLLFHSMLCTMASVLLFYAILSFTSASLGYSAGEVSVIMMLALASFTAPYVLAKTRIIIKFVKSIWFYPAVLFLGFFVILTMTQNIEMLLAPGVKAILFILAIMVAFLSGLAHRQAALFTEKLYPDAGSWFWYMVSVGVVSGVIIAQYMLLKFDLTIIMQTVMGMFLFMFMVAWWSLATLKNKSKA